ncbi:MAG: helix-turn-helix domain-containing protein [Acidimicrobiia bacterium]
MGVTRPDVIADDVLAGLVADVDSALAGRIVDAALACYARSGVTATTVNQIAAEAGVSRATLYRTFDGRAGIELAVVRREALAFLAAVDVRLRRARSLEDVVVAAFVDAEAVRRGHAVLRLMLEVEPELVLPTLMGPSSPVLDVGAAFLVPHVVEHAADHPLAAGDPRRFAEWVVRVGASYLVNPSPHVHFGDEASVRRFVADQFFANRHGTRERSKQ